MRSPAREEYSRFTRRSALSDPVLAIVRTTFYTVHNVHKSVNRMNRAAGSVRFRVLPAGAEPNRGVDARPRQRGGRASEAAGFARRPGSRGGRDSRGSESLR
ncbi:hypothetical protein J2S53_002456 [Actinopolyspora lacussalsi]|nr:hypothetical protein [Actinopolyspora lacussalsi]